MQVGIDIIEISRIKRAYERYNRLFLKRILTESEIEWCLNKPRPFESVAVRFACKEAFAKAMGTGISGELSWQSIEILNDKEGKPTLFLKQPFNGLKSEQVKLSLSHTHEYAVAVVIIEPDK
ncbi:holo-acyl-carrier-protein synthase [Chloroherpeton thalassium ATCC 35110]|uniref:Holo-[acyl-carrier-protein] synthase n=1 Tax=Chloroherpeton thalassium (strain ATCC 35110 / GB-78) TaxID=517418 RepID=ACPS_CHLT3|nr:holo-ACP synthase [Chloroherpeton thalassium]B3QTH9.1 RecName: Full=Holo-[acyl-carrier-protein] synthase; Short=Holo-ACP synthase; AltName: Full=4'-phosphopantetheinyl transferase AcpS [Chloroherpeton thalassium ATCC 35110]ACF12725.1 holo-acyl-carrier-protein synthase [Chloroherpeton thalassium ATCC 35110]